MLQLKDITKTYIIGEEKTKALNGICLEFRENEFVSILGASGCGKTTMLNIIGGLDKYTSGDLLIDGKSTKEFSDKEWDAYRNSEVGFVFQSYNLISHLSVLDNVAIALSLSGVSAATRKERAKKALADVGLEGHIGKKPNQLSGGQMQRVALARALVNNPSIILADEPTGALDSQTSIQIMEILKAISKDRLVVMVTHNGDLAAEYSDRIVRMVDGEITEDSCPHKEVAVEGFVSEKLKNKKTSMSFSTALKSSFKNMLTKKGRTIITSVAGSIGIIGVALVLAFSSGMSSYIESMQRDTLANFPISIDRQARVDYSMADMKDEMMNKDSTGEFPADNTFPSYDKKANTKLHTNVITQEYLDFIARMDSRLYNSISYTRSVAKNIVAKTSGDTYQIINSASGGDGYGGSDNFNEMPNSKEFIDTQYDVLSGNYPVQYNELALIVDKKNRIDTSLLAAFGIDIKEKYEATDLIGRSFKVVLNNDFYNFDNGRFVARNDYKNMFENANSIEIKISAVMRVKESANSEFLMTGIGFTTALTDKIIEGNAASDVVIAQKADTTKNVLTGTAFVGATYNDVLKALGGDTLPVRVRIYPKSFDTKNDIKKYLSGFNEGKEDSAKIIFSDLAEMIGETIGMMINTITVVLTAFAAISLVVSSIMIGIITYVSVVERTKEIGIMRAIGARKKDVSRIFNAEALLIGFASGFIGVLITMILCIPAGALVTKLAGVAFKVALPFHYGLILVALSMLLTFIAGLIPSRIASKKDPVVALRTE